MAQKPMKLLDGCIHKRVRQIICQIEDVNQEALVRYLRKRGISVGLAINFPTSVHDLNKRVLPFIDSILIMTINAGREGQTFEPRALQKIQTLRQYCGENTEIMVDGGINLETGKACLKAGATTLISNTFLWQNPETNFRKLQQLG